jgi:hypothetical protein
MTDRTKTRNVLLWAAMLACLLAAPSIWASEGCEGTEISSEISREESGSEVGATGPRTVFHVRLETSSECSKIRFELEATVQTEDGDNVIRRKPGQVKLSDSETHYKMVLNLNPGEMLADWKIELTHCIPCTVFAPE